MICVFCSPFLAYLYDQNAEVGSDLEREQTQLRDAARLKPVHLFWRKCLFLDTMVTVVLEVMPSCEKF